MWPDCVFCSIINDGLHSHELGVDPIRDVNGREADFSSSAVLGSLAGQACSPSAAQFGWNKVRLNQAVAVVAHIDASELVTWYAFVKLVSAFHRFRFSGDERFGGSIKLCNKEADLALVTGAIVLLLQSFANHARCNRRRSLCCGTQRSLTPVMRTAERPIRVLCVESGVVRSPLGRQDDEVGWDICPQSHFDSTLTGPIRQFAGATRQRPSSSRMDSAIRSTSFSRLATTTIAVDPPAQLPGSHFIRTLSASAGFQRPAMATNPWALTRWTLIRAHTTQTISKPHRQSSVPRRHGDRLALPWTGQEHADV